MNRGAPASGPAAGEEEILALRAEIARLHAEAGRNVELFQRTLERELAVLEAQTLPELLQVIVAGLRESYGLEAVTLVVQDPQHEIRHLLLGDGHAPEGFPGVVFTDSVLTLAPQMHSLARPWLGAYVSPDHQLLFPGVDGLASVAILPLKRGERLVGALNFGSADPLRFSRHYASDFLGHLGMIVGFAFDSACNRARLVRAGLTDFLTGWHNKRYLHSRLREEVARARRLGGPLALLMIDLDRFKEVNDSYGHLGGDAAIREVAMRIESEVRGSDAAARFGGDEFALVLPGAGPAEASQAARRVMQAVSSSPIELSPGVACVITVSVGLAVLDGASASGDLKSLAERLLADADAALYRAKASGRNTLEFAG
jgi:diguanylate cyclase (GGDEF)-like protein